MALGALGVGVETSVVGFGPVGLIARGMAEADAAALISGFFACFLVGRLSLVWIAVRVAPRYLLGGAFGLTGALLIAAQMGPPQLVFALAGAPVGILFPAYFYVASRRLGEGGRAAALIMAAVYVGAILTPVAMSLVIAELGAGALFPALAFLALAGAAGSLSLRRAAV
jgi:fucose permease